MTSTLSCETLTLTLTLTLTSRDLTMRILFVFTILVAACTSPINSDIQRQYTETVRRLGIVPVYPPREEFQVGDVFAVSLGWNPSTGDVNYKDSSRVWIGSLSYVAEAANDFMGSRIVFQESVAEGTAQPDLFRSGFSTRDSRKIRSLPIAAFPTISADAGFTAGLGVAKVLQAIGLGGGARTQVRLEFIDVRTYWVEKLLLDQDKVKKDVLLTLINSALRVGPNPIYTTLRQRERIDQISGQEISSSRCATIAVVTRIYLTRQIKYTYSNAAIIAAGIRRAEEGADLTSVPAPQRIEVNVNVDTGEPITSESTDTQLADLRNQMDTIAKSNSQGSGLNLEAWNALGISFSEKFSRPVAVGYEGFSFPTDAIEGYSKCPETP